MNEVIAPLSEIVAKAEREGRFEMRRQQMLDAIARAAPQPQGTL